MAKEGCYLLAPLCFSCWCLWAYLYFDIPRIKVPAPPVDTPFSQDPKMSFFDHRLKPQPTLFSSQAEKLLSTTPLDPKAETPITSFAIQEGSSSSVEPCDGRYIYVHELPRKFNEAILEDCENLIKYSNMCRHLENDGFGPELDNAEGIFSQSGWYDTHQFTLDVIFHHRIRQYDCLTRDSSQAAAIYVPFYGGFDVSRHLGNYSIQIRDALSHELVNWLKSTPEWRIAEGKDHFVVPGRITWEFRRLTEKESDFGNKLLLLPEVGNMTALNVESSPWGSSDFAIPYPTYFHPAKDAEVFFWQERMRKLKREWLFSFAGGPRPWEPRSIRNPVFDQCKTSNACRLLQCAHEGNICSPGGVIKLFQNSNFCLQPPGDSATRRSTFDAMLAGCIPVFFHPAAAYVQYIWYLPKNYTEYSVFIWEEDIRQKNVSIEEKLKQISRPRIQEMRENVIDLIPTIIYANPRSKSRTFKDAFDVALEAVIQRVTRLKRMNISDDYTRPEEIGSHEWDAFFNV